MTHSQPPHGQQSYPPQGWTPPPAPKRRRVWPWIVGAVILIPILAFAGCAALLGGAVKSVDDARQGGSVKIGQTFTYQSGLAVSVSALTPYMPSHEFEVGAGETAYETIVTITNGTRDPVGSSLILTSASVNAAPVEQVYDGAPLPTQQIPAGQQLKVPFRFKVKSGTKGTVQVSVTDTFNQPVFFTGTL